MMSTSGPPWAKNDGSTGPVRILWKPECIAFGSMPAASMLDFQTGIQPPLATIARPLAAVPMAAAVSPGSVRLTISMTVSST